MREATIIGAAPVRIATVIPLLSLASISFSDGRTARERRSGRSRLRVCCVSLASIIDHSPLRQSIYFHNSAVVSYLFPFWGNLVHFGPIVTNARRIRGDSLAAALRAPGDFPR